VQQAQLATPFVVKPLTEEAAGEVEMPRSTPTWARRRPSRLDWAELRRPRRGSACAGAREPQT